MEKVVVGFGVDEGEGEVWGKGELENRGGEKIGELMCGGEIGKGRRVDFGGRDWK